MKLNPRLRVVSVCIAALSLTLVSARADDADALIAKGNEFDKKLQAKEALDEYLPANKLEPDNVNLLCCIARQYRHLMTDATSRQEKLRLGNVSLEYANHAAKLGPRNAEAQLSPAISYGKMLPYMGSKDQVRTSPLIKSSVDRALELDPNNDTAWHILGRWNRVLAEVNSMKRLIGGLIYGELPKGSLEEAEHAMKKAIALNPDRPMHYIELGRIYAQMGKKEEARELINKGLAMPDIEKDDPETKERGRESLAKLQ